MKLSGARWPLMFLAEWPCGSVLALSHNLSAGLLLQQLCGTWWSQLISFQLFRWGIFVIALPGSQALRTFSAFVLFFLRFPGCDTRTGKGSRSWLCPSVGQHGVRWCIDAQLFFIRLSSADGWGYEKGLDGSVGDDTIFSVEQSKRRETFFMSLQ